MEKRTRSEKAAYEAGYRRGLRIGFVGTILGTMFATVAYDVLRDVNWHGQPSQQTVQPAASQMPPRMSPPA